MASSASNGKSSASVWSRFGWICAIFFFRMRVVIAVVPHLNNQTSVPRTISKQYVTWFLIVSSTSYIHFSLSQVTEPSDVTSIVPSISVQLLCSKTSSASFALLFVFWCRLCVRARVAASHGSGCGGMACKAGRHLPEAGSEWQLEPGANDCSFGA
jgi:hypothetical protein